ncbi:MAG: hypothetical protein P5702_11960 [Limnospira sp. PMC 1291.21]|uniref:Uncharacterized protein n=3 Tax=Limnospira TaxID=2596745 RepID=A0A9P1KJE0_9CYAN|nr:MULTISPECIES: hypothetical protein [Limnospira]EKD08530.1 hypothetical protein SPLC1_S230920 [Arthrospira platensis C1]MDC0839998.1 hypothetical protein [Limnoraphis robusta]MDT9182692.1 hypothetical protein [Limnospira sp. PMC 289.06]MDT9208027.1 hypothetical protein [Limnospira sp. PMC 1252.20]MDY7053057.1 hypothetical protein [Limnospira fusiformis LS22]QJB24971.1 hypothetical protein HFV01_03050 [Limnospira fusiformis SAG 85.79]
MRICPPKTVSKFLVVFPLIGSTITAMFPAQALTPQQRQEFQTNYLQGCRAGMAAENISPQRGEAFCNCTLDRLSKLPDDKLLALSNLTTQQEIMANRDFQAAFMQCSPTLIKD